MASLFDRSEFPALVSTVYLNQASLGLIGDPAVAAMDDLLHRVVRHGNVFMSDDDEVAFLDGLRVRASRLLEVDTSRIAIVASASELLGQAPFLLPVSPASTVLAIASDFPAVTRPWLRLQAAGGCHVEFVTDHPERDLTSDVVARIHEHTAVVAVGWVQYASGSIIDVPRLRAATRAVGARLVVDATQGAGAMPSDAASWDADLVVSSGYKWLGGHGGVAIGALAPDVVDQIPALPGWMGTSSPFAFDAIDLSMAPDARRFTQATMSYVSVVGLSAALDQLLSLGLDRIERHAAGLRKLLIEGAAARGWLPFRGEGDPAASPHIVALASSQEAGAVAASRLRGSGVVCSTRGDRLRVSLAPYNDEGDVAALIAALA